MTQTAALTAPRLLNSEQQAQKEQLFEAGNAAFDAEKFQAAFENYHRASLIDPGDAEVWSALGLAYANLDYPREAWRSYRLALLADPENLNALWYAAEFLYNHEDFELCKLLLQRYLLLEEESEARDEAEELLQEVRHLLDDDETAPLHSPGTEDGEILDDDDGSELPAGFDSEDGDDAVTAAADDDDFSDDDDPDYEAVDSGAFYASVELRLGDLSAKCKECATPLPWDAPYCYACSAPCFYSESSMEA